MSVNISSHSLLPNCHNSTDTIWIGTAFNFTRAVLVLPLTVYVLYLGLQRWRQQRPGAMAGHSDVFTYHLAALQFIWALGFVLFFWGPFNKVSKIWLVPRCLYSITWFGENTLNVLTCVERYLAVVHPITYMLRKNRSGARIRNICIGCSWVFCVGWSILLNIYIYSYVTILLLCSLSVCLVVVSFCSLSALWVLSRTKPGEGLRKEGQVDQAKKRAFHTIIAITGVLWIWFLAVLVSNTVREQSEGLNAEVRCLMVASLFWFSLPTSLMLPLLYLQRAGKLAVCLFKSRDK